MKRTGAIVLLCLVLVFSVQADSFKPLKASQHELRSIYEHQPLNHQVKQFSVPSQPADPVARYWNGELDELLGDTIVVGDTYYNSQHNGTIGRMIGLFPGEMNVSGDTVDHVVFFTWMDKPDPLENVHVNFHRAYTDDDGNMIPENNTGGYQVDNLSVAAYTTLGMDDVNGFGYPTYHGGGVDAMDVRIAVELDIFPGLFQDIVVPGIEGNAQFWPRGVFAPETGYMHIVTTNSNPGEDNLAAPQDIYYSRHERTPEGQNPFDIQNQVLATDLGRNISGDIAVSDDGSRVAIGQTISRDFIPPENTPDDWTQLNQDVYVWISENGGETWDWDNPLNVTDFIWPDLNLLPDTLAACRDTLRAHADCNVYFDHNDVLHVAFTVGKFYEVRGTYLPRWSMVYHWDEESDVVTMIADGYFGILSYDCGAWQRTRQRPSMYQDPVTGILWCSISGYGHAADPDTTVDVSDAGYANAEVYVTASPPNSELGDWYGRLWAKEVNITNSEWFGENAAGAGECRSESDPNLSLNNDGDCLNIFYIQDYLGGNARQEEGAYTLNDAVWHKVAKQDLLDAFEEQGLADDEGIGWVENYPMHVGGETQHWTDEDYAFAWTHDDWAENDNFYRGEIPEPEAVADKDKLLPDEFSLEQNYPNPFNPVTHINFSLERRGIVKLAVYDVLGREIAVLISRMMHSGGHSVTFDGSHLASGMYFVKLSSGDAVHTRKMVLMK